MHLALAEAKKAGAVFTYASFIAGLINFLILAFIIFQMVKILNKAKRDEVAPAPTLPSEDILLLSEIRDALKQ